MKTDKVLLRMELENRKAILIASKHKIKEGIEVKTNRGIYKITHEYAIGIAIIEIEYEIKQIDIELEEITGLNQDKMDYYNRDIEV